MSFKIRRGPLTPIAAPCSACMSGGCLECKGGALVRSSVYGGAMQLPQHVPAPTSLLYFNMSLFNPATAPTSVAAAMIETRTTPLIETPEEWEMSIVRFDLSSNLIPPMVFPMPQPPVAGTNLPSLLTVTLNYLGVDYQTTVQIDVASTDSYGYVFSFDELCTRLNAAFATSFALFSGGLPAGAAPPVMYFNAVTQMFQLFCQKEIYVDAANPVFIWLNQIAYKYMLSMPAFKAFGLPNGKEFRLQVERVSSTFICKGTPIPSGQPEAIATMAGTAPGTLYTVIALTQVAPSVGSTNGVRSILITTSLLPINSEGIPSVTTTGQSTSTSSNSTPVVSDFLLSTNPADNPVQDRISISYLPTAEYRMIQLRGRTAIKQVDLKFYFTLFDGTQQEVFINRGGYCSAKILFRRSERSILSEA